MKIVGISCFYHDSAVALIENGAIVYAAAEERFSRKKHDNSFPINSLECLIGFLKPEDEVEAFVYYEKPILKFERLLETYYSFAPKGFISFYNSIPLWVKEKLFIKEILKSEISKVYKKKINILFSEHHLSHLASAFYPSPFEKAAILSVDGVGEWATVAMGYGSGNEIEILKEMHYPHSVGLLYSAFTYYLGFKVNSGEYKLMGLAPYGNPYSSTVKKYINLIKDNLVSIKDDGSIYLNQDYFSYSTEIKMLNEDRWLDLFKLKRREPEGKLLAEHCDMAYAIQNVIEEILLKMVRTIKNLTDSENLCLAGGVALNCVANSKISNSNIFKKIWIQPASGDSGGALGAALSAYYMAYGKKRNVVLPDLMKGSYLGPQYLNKDIDSVIEKYGADYSFFSDEDELCAKTANYINEGKVVGWFQGRMEWGPRALGNRSILADPRNPDMQRKVNLKIKHREGFRPFAPSVLWEDYDKYFEGSNKSPYMLFIDYLKVERRKNLPDNFWDSGIEEKLYFLKSDLPTITHMDYSARVQSVHKETNPLFYKLISKFKEISGYSIILNTSFNVRGEPIVMTPEDAYICFMKTEMDILVIGRYIFEKEKQRNINLKHSDILTLD